MGKKEQTIYTCDRCGMITSDEIKNMFGLRKYRYMYGFGAYVTTDEFEDKICLCPNCGKDLRRFLKGSAIDG